MRPPHFRERIARKVRGKVVAYIDVDESAGHVEFRIGLNGADIETMWLTKRELKAALAHVEKREWARHIRKFNRARKP